MMSKCITVLIFLFQLKFKSIRSKYQGSNDLTKLIKHYLKNSLEVFQNVITYESCNLKTFSFEPKVRN